MGVTSVLATATKFSASGLLASACQCRISRRCLTQGSRGSQEWAVSLKCLGGADAGVEVVYKPTTVGGIQAVAGLIEAVRDRLNGGQHDGAVAPIVRLDKDSYLHDPHGRVWTPRADDCRTGCRSSGPAPAPAPEPSPLPPTEQPRRRRVA